MGFRCGQAAPGGDGGRRVMLFPLICPIGQLLYVLAEADHSSHSHHKGPK